MIVGSKELVTQGIPYNTLDKLVDLLQPEFKHQDEVTRALVWYHHRATGDRAVDHETIWQYYAAAELAPPPADTEERGLPDCRPAFSEGYHSLNQHFMEENDERFHDAVFKSGLPVFKITKDRKGRFIWSLPSRRRLRNPLNLRGVLFGLLWFANEHPFVGLIHLCASIIGIAAVVKYVGMYFMKLAG